VYPNNPEPKSYYIYRSGRPEKDKVYTRVYGTNFKDPKYERTNLSPEEIAIFKAIDFGAHPLEPSEGKRRMEQGFKNIMSLVGAKLVLHKWDEALASDARFLKDEEGKLLPEYDPRNAISIKDVDWGMKSRDAYVFFAKKRAPKEIMDRFKQNIHRKNVQPIAQEAASAFIEKQLNELMPVYDKIFKLSNEDFFTQWVKGEFKYKRPILETVEDQETFRDSMRILLASYPADYLGDPKTASQTVWDAVDRLMERLIEHETGLRLGRESEQEAKAQKEAERRTREEAREREKKAADEAREKEKHEAFMAKPQAYPLSHQTRSLINHLQTAQADSLAAKWVAEEIPSLAATLDIRNETQKALGDLVLSESNTARAALAMGSSSLKLTHAAAVNHLEENAGKLAALCQDPDTRKATEAMEGTDSGMLLLACLTLEPAAYASYTQAVMAPARWQAQLNTLVERYMNAEQCSQHDVLTLASDPDCAKDDTRLAEIAHVRDMLEKAKALDLKSAREALASQVQEAMHGNWMAEGTNALSGADETLAAPTREARRRLLQEPEQPVEMRPKQNWLAEMKNDFTWETTPNNPLSIRIHNAQDPSIFADICPGAPESDVEFKRLLTELTSEFAHKAATVSLIESLTTEAGFTFDASTHTLRHCTYDNMHETLKDSYREQVAQISALSERFQEALFQQEASVETARMLGITPPEDTYLSSAQMQALRQAMDAAQLAPDSETEALKKPERSKTVSDKKTWLAPPNTNLLIFDSSSLFKLCASRNKAGDSWMDIIRCTAKLPNVKVIIPAVVADLEMRGQIPIFDNHGNHKENIQVDERFIDNRHPLMESHFTNMNPIAESATRIMMPVNGGEPYIERQGDPNIIIVDTPGDKDLWSKIMSLKRCNEDKPVHVMHSQLSEHIYGNGEGEKAINRIVQSRACRSSAIIISDDMRYLHGYAGASPDQVAVRTSLNGMPVGQCSADMYLRAETNNRQRITQLQAELQHPEAPLFYRIAEDLRRAGRKNNDTDWDLFLGHSAAGFHRNGEPGPQINRVISTGIRQAAGEAVTDDTAAPPPILPKQDNPNQGWVSAMDEAMRKAQKSGNDGENLPGH
jgi:hypothetical protein